MDDSKVKTSRSVKRDEREVGGKYDTQSSQLGTVTQIATERDDGTIPIPVERQPTMDKLMEPAEEPVTDVEMDDVEINRESL